MNRQADNLMRLKLAEMGRKIAALSERVEELEAAVTQPRQRGRPPKIGQKVSDRAA